MMAGGKSKKFVLEDVGLSGAASEFTAGVLSSKGWTYPNGINALSTSSATLQTTLNLVSFPQYILNEDVRLKVGVQYTLRVYTTNSSGSGTKQIALTITDSGGTVASSTTTVTTTDGWKTLTFTPDESLNDVRVGISNATNTDSYITFTEVELYEG